MEKHFFISLVVLFLCLVSHLFGYFVPTVTFVYYSCYISLKAALFLIFAMIGLLASLECYVYSPRRIKLEPLEGIVKSTEKKISDFKFPSGRVKDTPLVSRDVDDVIEELISLLLKDYVNSWHDSLIKHPNLFCKSLKDPIRQILFTFRDRCREIDDVKLFATDIVIIITDHLQHIKASIINTSEHIQPYKVYPFLSSKEKELDYLRTICDFFLATLLPPEYIQNKPLQCLLREVFAVAVFYPVIDKLCDPDCINAKLITYLKQQQAEAEKHSRTYAYAETYEDFIKLIQESNKIDDLQRMRYYILSEIMQATTMNKIKRSKGMDVDKEFNPQKTNKGDLLQARNLTRYLNQLRFAKTQCEKRLKALGGPDYTTSNRTSDSLMKENSYIPGQKVLSMSVIMQSSLCRRYLSKFLQKEEVHSLLGFWEAVEDMKESNKETWHKLGNEIVQMYVHNQSSSVRLNKNTLKGIEEFMMANKGPDAFFQAQEEIYKILEENYYASFIVSDVYHKMIADVEKQGIDFMQEIPGETEEAEIMHEHNMPVESLSETADISVFDHSSYARSQLKVLTEKLGIKRQALKALKNNPKCDKKVIEMMENEIIHLVHEKNLLENHIEKTELWIEYLGVWQASIMEALEKKDGNDKLVPYFAIRVHLASDADIIPNQMVGWVVTRSLSAFHSLHQKLVPAANWLKKLDLPTKPRFKSLDKNYLEKAKNSLQILLTAVTKDDGLNKSEALYDFLSPSPEYMKHPPCPVKKPFKIFQFLRGVQITLGQFDDPDEEELLFLDDNDNKEDKKDSIAEPLYTLIGEIFELKGVFNWLRRTLIIFVQVTYGQTINRQVRETVSWILSEPMLLFYLQLFRDTMWPSNQVEATMEGKTKEEKLANRIIAKQMFLNNIPDLLNNLIGQQNAKKGMSKLFDALQNGRFNKQLLYKIFEAFLYEYAPELKKDAGN